MRRVIFASAAFAAMLGVASCGSTQKAPQASKSEQENPYGAQVFKTKSEQLAEAVPGKRASGKGVSFSESTARQLAELEARAQMSRSIDAAIITASQSVGVNITKYAGGNNEGMSNTDGGEQQKAFLNSISSNIISNTTVINTDKFYGKDRKYTVFVCLEYNGSVADMARKASEQVKQLVSDDDRAKIQAENEKYKQEVERNLNYK